MVGEFLQIISNIAAGPPQRKGRPDDGRESDALHNGKGFIPTCGITALRDQKADGPDGLFEFLTVLGLSDRIVTGSDEFNPIALKHAPFLKRHGHVEGRLTSHRGKESVRPLTLDDLFYDIGDDGLDVG